MLQQMHRRQFIDTSGVLLDWYLTCCSSDVTPLVREQKTKLKGLVLGNAEREKECLQAWHAAMSETLPTTVRYAPALKRILGVDGCAYHACEYSDMIGLLSACHAEALEVLGLDEFVDTQDADTKKTLWMLIKQINSHSLHYYDVNLTTPTREDIQANIKMHKAAKTPIKPAMTRGFETTMAELAALMGAKPVDWSDAHAPWTEAREGLARAYNARDVAALRTMPFSHEGLRNLFDCAPDDVFTEEMWQYVDKLNSLTAVQNGIPPKMMKTIESKAHALASEIAAGTTDMSSINLAELGQSVIEQCDVSDVEAIANNMSSLLPMLQGLQQR